MKTISIDAKKIVSYVSPETRELIGLIGALITIATVGAAMIDWLLPFSFLGLISSAPSFLKIVGFVISDGLLAYAFGLVLAKVMGIKDPVSLIILLVLCLVSGWLSSWLAQFFVSGDICAVGDFYKINSSGQAGVESEELTFEARMWMFLYFSPLLASYFWSAFFINEHAGVYLKRTESGDLVLKGAITEENGKAHYSEEPVYTSRVAPSLVISVQFFSHFAAGLSALFDSGPCA